MTKQRLEGDLADILKKNNVLYSRIYHVAGAYTNVPGDFWIFNNKVALVECKECRNGRWVFGRFTQEKQLLKFNEAPIITSFIIICFWHGRKTKSEYYVIPVLDYLKVVNSLEIKSLNNVDFKELFGDFICSYEELPSKLTFFS